MNCFLISSLKWVHVQVRWLSIDQVIEHFQGKFKHRSVSKSEIYEMHFWQHVHTTNWIEPKFRYAYGYAPKNRAQNNQINIRQNESKHTPLAP